MNRIGHFIILVLMAVFLSGCQGHRAKTASLPSPEPETEEYEVYSFLLEGENFQIKNDTDDIVVICGTTVATPIVDRYDFGGYQAISREGSYLRGLSGKISISEIGKDTLDDFEKKNMNSSTLDYQFEIKTKYLLYSDEERLEFRQSRDFFSLFYTRYPNSHGHMGFSRVGFNSNRTKAAVYHEWSAGNLAGGAHFILLTKVNGKWIVKKQITIWVS